MKTLIVIQARLGSKRLPFKVLKEIENRPLLLYTLERLKRLNTPNQLVVATTSQKRDDAIVSFCEKNKIDVFRGSEENVLERYYQCAVHYKADIIVRITGDCPLIDPNLVDKMVKFYQKNLNYDYISNVHPRSYPKGLDVEILNFKALSTIYSKSTTSYQLEHVTPYIMQNGEQFNCYNFSQNQDQSDLNVSVDTLGDFIFVQKIIQENYYKNPLFEVVDIYDHLKKLCL